MHVYNLFNSCKIGHLRYINTIYILKLQFNSSMDQLCPTFKANPPTVLKKPPFIPEKPPKPAVGKI